MTRALRKSIGGVIAASVIVMHAPSQASGSGGHAVTPSAPLLLSDTGLYGVGGHLKRTPDADALTIDPRNRPFAPQYPLWSDGAHKQRWVYLPPGSPIDVTNMDAWTFPIGTKFWKEFSFNGRRVETRFLWRADDRGWVFASYKWNDEQTDAALAPAEGEIAVADIDGTRQHSIPSIEECRACHDSARTEILGFTALQLSTDRDPNAIHGEPLSSGMITLETLLDEGTLKPSRTDLLTRPPRIAADNPRARAVLGYLSTNCGMCHNGDSSLAALGMLLKQTSHAARPGGNTALDTTVGQASKWQLPAAGEDTSRRITAGVPELSALLYRMKSRRPSSQMPPLGTVVPDHDAIVAVSEWIKELK